jgi:hypothetical protein
MEKHKMRDDVEQRQLDDALAAELAERWGKLLLGKTWHERLYVIADLFEHVRESIGDFSRFCEIFPDTIAQIIYRLGDHEVTGVEQAHLYASSRDAAHRSAAGAWFRQHGAQSGVQSDALPDPLEPA